MVKRLLAIGFIFCCTTVAWAILGATINARTDGSRTTLRGKVASVWGAPQEQSAPSAAFVQSVTHSTVTTVNGKRTETTTQKDQTIALPLESSRLEVALDLDYRQKGLLWYSTYRVGFAGQYAFRNSSAQEQNVTFTFRLPVADAVYDGLEMKVDNGQSPALARPVSNLGAAATVSARMAAGSTATLKVSYRSQGLDWWRYAFSNGVAHVRDFHLRVKTNFRDVDFAENTLAPVAKSELPGGWDLQWNYQNLVSGYKIAVVMPEKLQPGPLAGEISFFAPVSLFFFFFILLILTTLRNIDLHPMNYFFLAAAFFSFHLLLAYLADRISIHWAFAISSMVSVFLVASYLRLAVGPRFALVEAAGAQLIYLVLFSYAFFFQGLTGLAVTIGAILTLFLVMQLTARIRWTEVFAGARPS